MNGEVASIAINGMAVDSNGWASPELAAIRELLRQRALALGLLAPDGGAETTNAAIDALLEREVKTPAPSEAECRRFYEGHPELFRSGDLVFVRHILFQVTPGSPLNLVRAKAEQTLARVAQNPDEFETCAKTLSNCPSGQHGGNLGQIGRNETVPEFEQALFGDGWIGILPRLVKTRYGFHIVAIDRRTDGRHLPFDIVRQQVSERLAERVQQVALRQYVRVLAGQADIKGVDLGAASTPLVQ